jgi:thiamine-phosphate pyrophosphorylase
MSLSLPRCYPIVDHSDWLPRLLPIGVKLVQLRVKDRSNNEVITEIRRAKQLCEQHGAQLIVNDYWKLALEAGCNYVHLGQEDLDTADIVALKNTHIRIGISTHDHTELERALSLEPDYIALGPIYPTLLKKMPFGPQGLERIIEWKQRIGNIPLVAIGGLTIERLPGVFASGADSAAVVSDILRNEHPEMRAVEWLKACG